MHIAIFSECYLPVTNGVVTSIVTLRSALRSLGHRVSLFAPGAPQSEDDEEVFRLPELPFPRHPYHLARPFPRPNIDFNTLGVDLVHCQHPFTVGRLGADLARRHGIPMVYTAHSLYDIMMAEARSPIVRTMGQRAARGVVRRFCARADYVIAPSGYTRDWLRAGGITARFAVVPSGVYPPTILEGERDQTRQMLGVPPEAPLVLYLGRLGPEKRLDMMLRAIAILRKRRLPSPAGDFRLAIVGDGQTRSALEELAQELGIADRVIFTGQQPHENIGSWYAAADVFALSAPMETQGLVLVEAMAAGLPCVAVDRGGAREIIANRSSGILAGCDAPSFARALEALLMDPAARAALGARGMERAAAYSPDAMARGVLAVYEAALRLPRQPANYEPATVRGAADIRRLERARRTRFRTLKSFASKHRRRWP